MKAIGFNDVSEKYRIKFLSDGKVSWEEIYALRDVSFEVHGGEVLGVIGENGAGKTTLLKLIAGMLVPDKGSVEVAGKVSALMELGAGFNLEFTGRENILINARLYGIEEDSLESVLAGIVEFAGLGRFIDAPIKYYSQGMYMRLAFALAIFVDPDILLIDDILAVGDEESRRKCIKKINELKSAGKTIVLVSHDMEMVRRLCDRVMLLEKGAAVKTGTAEEVIPRYLETSGNKKGIAVIKEGNVRLTFNNGRLIVSSGDAYVSSGMGGYVSFYDTELDCWSLSANLDWHIEKKSGHEILALGSSEEEGVVQLWELAVVQNRIAWKVETKSRKINQAHIDWLVSFDYKQWESMEKEGMFPLLGHKHTWQEVGTLRESDGVLGIQPDSEERTLPFLLITQENKGCQFKLLNTGYDIESRVVQVFLSGDRVSLGIDLFEEEGDMKKAVRHRRDEEARKRREEEQEKRRLYTITSGALGIYCDARQNFFEIRYKDVVLSRGSGLQCWFLSGELWYDISSAIWDVEKRGSEIILRLSWMQPRFVQVWRLFLQDDTLRWETESEYQDGNIITMIKFGLVLDERYRTYFCGGLQGMFPAEFVQWMDMPVEEITPLFMGVRKQENAPAIMMGNAGGFFCVVQNSDKRTRCRTLQCAFTEAQVREPGKKYFSSDIKFLEDEREIEDYLREETRKALIRKKEEEKENEFRTLVSGDLKLFADRSHKSLRLYYKGREFTRDSGMQTAFLFGKNWYDISTAEWDVVKENDCLTVTFSWPKAGWTQVWSLTLKNTVLRWEVRYRYTDSNGLEELKFGLLLEEGYTSYFCGHQRGNFPDEFAHWENMLLENNWAEKFGSGRHPGAPAIVMEQGGDFGVVIQNSDNLIRARALQCALSGAQVREQKKNFFSTVIEFFEDDREIDEYCREENERFLAGKKLDEERQNIENTIASGMCRIFVDCKRKALQMYYKDREITVSRGFYSQLNAEKQLGIFYSSEARWEVEKNGESEMTVRVKHPLLSVSQLWTLSCFSDNTVKLKIEIDVEKEGMLNNWLVRLELRDVYDRWLTDMEEGVFSDMQYIRDTAPVRLRDNRVPFVLLKPAPEGKDPMVSFETVVEPDKAFLGMYKQKGPEETCLCVVLSSTDPRQGELLRPGRYVYFEGKIEMGGDAGHVKRRYKPEFVEVGGERVKFFFDRGRGRLFFGEKELTTGLGVYTSLRFLGIWYDSYQAAWHIQEKTDNRMVVRGCWPSIPVIQVWRIEVMNGDTFLWDVDMQVGDTMMLELQQSNIMLIPEFKAWKADGCSSGVFSEEYSTDYDILPFRFCYGKSDTMRIEVNAPQLPPLIFKSMMEEDALRMIVENSDFLYRARLVQFQKKNTALLSPGTYRYFKGAIHVGNNI
ncbi:MAG: ABC transporter ATP-binding protein [Candidatus Omnitrophica bacterium]|nr:ABC transporter ATP-binding protein [Candidatus Omnitrophota bacterium]